MDIRQTTSQIVCCMNYQSLVIVECLNICSRIICTAAGFALTKADLFPLVAARGAGQIALVSGLLKSQSHHTRLIPCMRM